MLGIINFSETESRLRSFSDIENVLLPRLKDGLVTISPLQAKKIVSTMPYPFQDRHEKADGRAHIEVLAAIMKRGKWREKEKLDFATFNGKTYLLNGHHRLSAQFISGETIDWIVAVHSCRTFDEIKNLYHSFDTNVRMRTSRNVLAAHDMSEELGLGRNTTNSFFKCIPLLVVRFDFRRTEFNHIVDKLIDERLDAMRSYNAEAKLWETALVGTSDAIRKRLSNVGSMAVALTTFRHQPEMATKFWSAVAGNSGLNKGEPAHTYVNYILSNSSRKGGSEETARAAIHCWNAFFEGRSITSIRMRIGGALSIAGTDISREAVDKKEKQS